VPESGLTHIGRYELRERLGAGGMARVYKAWDTTLQRMVAIKVLYEHLAEDPNFKERFEREARFVAGFNHPNIVQLYDFDALERDGFTQYYMVMSYVPGRTLRREIEQAGGAGLSRVRVLELARDLASALDYAHQRGMVHRDVKPSNILIDEQNRAVLSDFGIARMVKSPRLTLEGTSTGTPAYMSPEQAAGEAGDARSDLYALGIILFELLTGQPPFDDTASVAVMLKHVQAEIPSYSLRVGSPDPALEQFFYQALAKDPAARFQTGDALVCAFTTALSGEPFATGPDHRRSPLDTASRSAAAQLRSVRRRQRALGATSLFAALILVALFVLSQAAPGSEGVSTPAPLPAGLDGKVFFSASFGPGQPENDYWPQQFDPPFVQRITDDGFYRLSTELPFTAENALFMGGDQYDNVLILLEATLEATSAPSSAYGIVFRYQDLDNYNVFAVDGAGRFSLWVRERGVWRELRGAAEGAWSRDESVRPIGESNRLTLEVRGSSFAAYVNSRPVARVSDATLTPGRVGIYLASDDGPATVLVDEYRVRDSTSSMTGR